MKRPPAIVVMACAGLAAALGAWAWQDWSGAGAASDAAAPRASGISRAAALDGAGQGRGRPWPADGAAIDARAAKDEVERVPLLPVESKQPAWLSMADARANGDPRTPPLQRDEAPRAAPDAALLADPTAYAAYQRSQHQQLLGAYASAAGDELPRLRADAERGRAAGVPAAEMAKLEEKIRLIEQQRAAARQAQRAP